MEGFSSLVCQRFSTDHFEQYASWLEDDRMAETLGGIDAEWLEYIMTDETGAEYAFLRHKVLVAVVGITFPTKEYPRYVINNIAVNPQLSRKGIGSAALRLLHDVHPTTEGMSWVAYVAPENTTARSFFVRNNWAVVEREEDFLRFEKQSPG